MNEEKGEKANIPNKIWYARKKMNIVKMKLNGVHPTKITWLFIVYEYRHKIISSCFYSERIAILQFFYSFCSDMLKILNILFLF